jgi:hypothetical protein
MQQKVHCRQNPWLHWDDLYSLDTEILTNGPTNHDHRRITLVDKQANNYPSNGFHGPRCPFLPSLSRMTSSALQSPFKFFLQSTCLLFYRYYVAGATPFRFPHWVLLQIWRRLWQKARFSAHYHGYERKNYEHYELEYYYHPSILSFFSFFILLFYFLLYSIPTIISMAHL